MSLLHLHTRVLVRASLMLLCMGLAHAENGVVTGVVALPPASGSAVVNADKYRGKISGKVDPPPPPVAAVWLEGPQLSAPKKVQPVVLGQQHYQFSHSLIVVPLGTTVFFPNHDADYHNIFSLSRTKRFDLGRYKKDENPAPSVTFDTLGFVSLRCEIHDHMNASVVVVNTPYYTLSAKDGTFTLANVPPGSYTLHAQAERTKVWKVAIRVMAGKVTTTKLPVP